MPRIYPLEGITPPPWTEGEGIEPADEYGLYRFLKAGDEQRLAGEFGDGEPTEEEEAAAERERATALAHDRGNCELMNRSPDLFLHLHDLVALCQQSVAANRTFFTGSVGDPLYHQIQRCDAYLKETREAVKNAGADALL